VATDDVQQVIGYELALLTPHVRRSQARVEQLLDPDFREIGASGRFWTRPEMVSALAETDTDGEPIEATEVEGAVVGPDLILVTYVSDPRGRAARRSSLWRRSGGGWRLLHHQGTLLNSV
jgi:hypothetical protein